MRVVSLVPSWTETLLTAGVEVVGRSRFCIHPQQVVKNIPAVGGTKNWQWPKILELKPDLLILDQEENPKFMVEQDEIPFIATHVVGIESMPVELNRLADGLKCEGLGELAQRWTDIHHWEGLKRWKVGDSVPGLLEWGRAPIDPVKCLVYVIWRNPWMCVARNTFIGSMLGKCGFADYLRNYDSKYPEIDFADYPPAETLLFFSSEPYPFLKKKSVLNPISQPYGFVDGECFSWFGVRTLKFLEGLRSPVP